MYPLPTAKRPCDAIHAMAPAPPTTECLHRGEVLRTVTKDVCCGRHADFKVYVCALHGECCLGGAVARLCPCPDQSAPRL